MADVIRWLADNATWIFSGIGVLFISWIGYFIFQRKKSIQSQKIKSGDNSTNVQVGGDLNLGSNSSRNNVEKDQ